MPLTSEQIAALLQDKPKPPAQQVKQVHKSARNTKHVTWHDTEMRCLSKRCGSPTYIKVMNVPLCNTHTILKLADMLDPKELGEL